MDGTAEVGDFGDCDGAWTGENTSPAECEQGEEKVRCMVVGEGKGWVIQLHWRDTTGHKRSLENTVFVP